MKILTGTSDKLINYFAIIGLVVSVSLIGIFIILAFNRGINPF